MNNITSSLEKEINRMGPFTEGACRIGSIPYALPTAIRRFKKEEYGVGFLEKGEKTKYLLGAGVGAFVDLVSIVGYPFLAFGLDCPEALLLPAATNAISLMYEARRLAVKDLKNTKIESKE